MTGLAFPEVIVVVGLLLILTASASGLARGTIVSTAMLAVSAGIALAGLDVLTLSARDSSVIALIELALLFTLFSDGLTVERELLRPHAAHIVRALGVAMPLTMVLIGAVAKLLFDQLSWAEALLLGAILAPTDPVITSAVLAAREIPARLRHLLKLESGLNDGLALPFVLVLIGIAVGRGDAGREILRLLGDALAGGLIGMIVAVLAGRALAHIPGGGLATKYEAVYALGIALLAFGLAESIVGSGFIAAFIAGLALAIARHNVPRAFHQVNDSIGTTLQVITLFVFGALVFSTGLPDDGVAAAILVVVTLLLARPIAVGAALIGSDLPHPQRAFIAWFGPKGVASMLFALFALKSGTPHGALIFQLASIVILGSVVAHGLTDTLGARWIGGRLARGQVRN